MGCDRIFQFEEELAQHEKYAKYRRHMDVVSAEIKLGDHSHEIIATITTIKAKPTCLVFLYSGQYTYQLFLASFYAARL